MEVHYFDMDSEWDYIVPLCTTNVEPLDRYLRSRAFIGYGANKYFPCFFITFTAPQQKAFLKFDLLGKSNVTKYLSNVEFWAL